MSDADSKNHGKENGTTSTSNSDGVSQNHKLLPGSLPSGAKALSNAARGLLMRLLERDPKVRMKNLRQLQQTAFYMSFNFEHVKAKKVSPRSILNKYFPNGAHDIKEEGFEAFDQLVLI